MRHKPVIIVLILILFSLSLLACGKPKEVKVAASRRVSAGPIAPAAVSAPAAVQAAVQPVAPPKPELPKYVYKSSGRRDPFVPLVGKSETRASAPTGEVTPTSASEVNIGSLTVQGLIWDKARPYVLLKAPDGTSYIVTENKLVDDRGRVIKGIAAVVQKDKVVLISKDKVIKEFKFSKIREESD